jgi:hypothetical protein
MTTETDSGVRATKMVIGGEAVDAADGQTFDVVDPATGSVIATVPLGGREDVDRAVAAAQAAFDDRVGWANWAAGKRGRSLAKLAALIKDHSEELAQLESQNVGKPIGGARGEIIGFLDDDLFVPPGWLTAVLECFERTGTACVGARPGVVSRRFLNPSGRDILHLNGSFGKHGAGGIRHRPADAASHLSKAGAYEQNGKYWKSERTQSS